MPCGQTELQKFTRYFLKAVVQLITKIKEERNKAQDELAELRKILELSDDISLTEHITKIKINIDKEQVNQYYISTKKSFSGVRKILLLIQRKGTLGEFLFTFHKIQFYNIYYEHKVALDRIFRVVKTAEISLLVFPPLLLQILRAI